MDNPTIGDAFAYALEAVKGTAILTTGQHRQEAVKRLISFLDLYSDMTDEVAREVTDEVYSHFFQCNQGAFYMTSCLQQALKDRKLMLSNGGEKLVMVMQIRIAKLMCDNLDQAEWPGHIAGAHMERAYWLAQAIYPKDRIASRRLMRMAGKGLRGGFVDAFFWRLHAEAKDKPGSIVEDLLESLTEGMLQKNGAVEIFAQYLRRSGRNKRASDAVVATFERHQQERRERAALQPTERVF
jgi:hypothetical protein